MAIKVSSIINLVESNSEVHVYIGYLVLNYAALKQKLDNPAGQSWYFQKGIESNKEKLVEKGKSFLRYQHNFNTTTVDELIASKEDYNIGLEKLKSNFCNYTMMSIAVSSLRQKIRYADELLLLKSKIDWLQDIDFYMGNPDELNKLLAL